ncbi:MAG TPA: glycosyltransferase family 2 protein [Clostridiaceae bacterium]
MGNKKLTILVPLFNEEESLILLYHRVTKIMETLLDRYEYELLLINDGSTDNSFEVIKDMREKNSRVSYINLSRNYGKEIAMMAGLDKATGDAVVILDADLQDPPELIPEMLMYFEAGYDDVYGKRKSRKGESWLKRKTSSTFYKVLKKMSNVPIQEDTGDFRLLSRRAVEALKRYKECNRYTKGYFSLIGFRKKEILFDRDTRAAGKTKWNYFKLFELAKNGITSFSTAPLRAIMLLGYSIAIISGVYVVFIIGKTILFNDHVKGYPSLACLILFLSAVQLISIGIIGEYLGRIFYETKNRPLYFIDEYNGERDNF